jgi:hypothetical protein
LVEIGVWDAETLLKRRWLAALAPIVSVRDER